MTRQVIYVGPRPEPIRRAAEALDAREVEVRAFTREAEAAEWVADPLRVRGVKVVLVDLGAGGAHGLRALAALREAPSLEGVPVVALGREDDPRWAASAYRAGADSCVSWTPERESAVRSLSLVLHYWLHLNRPEAGSGRFTSGGSP